MINMPVLHGKTLEKDIPENKEEFLKGFQEPFDGSTVRRFYKLTSGKAQGTRRSSSNNE
jgi:hypothetical protein